MLGCKATPGDWRIEIPDRGQLCQGRSCDRLAFNWLWNNAACKHRVPGRERLPELLFRTPSLLWRQGATLHGAMLVSLYQQPVASVRQVALREAADVPSFMSTVLPRFEQRLSDMGMAWLSLHRCPDWLTSALPSAGFGVHDTVVHYGLEGLDDLPLPSEGAIAYRRASLVDTEVILAVDAAAFEPFWRINRAIVREGLRQAAYALVAELQGQIVGYLLAERWPADVYVSRIAVQPALQGRGIGRGLMLAAIQRFRADGIDRIVLNTQQSNWRSAKLYKGLGFVATGDEAIYWSKRLGVGKN